MSSRRTMVDRLDTGDGFTFAVLSLVGLGKDVEELAADPQPHLRVVTDASADADESHHGSFDSLMLGLVALAETLHALIPAPVEHDAERQAEPPIMPRQLLR